MKTILFYSEEYPLISIDVIPSRLGAALEKGEYSIDTLLSEIEQSETVTVKQNGEIIGVYNGYTDLLSLSIHAESISVELINHDIQMQIDEIGQAQAAQGEAIEELDDALSNVEDAVDGLTPYEITKTAYIDDESVEFENVPENGKLSVYLSDPSIEYTVERDQDRVTVNFDPLTEVIEVTLSIL